MTPQLRAEFLAMQSFGVQEGEQSLYSNLRKIGVRKTFLNSEKGLGLEEKDISYLPWDVCVVYAWKREFLGLSHLSTQFLNNC